MSLVTSMEIFLLNEEDARMVDAKRPEGKKLFAAMLPGGNAYILDASVVDDLELIDIDPEYQENGFCFAFDRGLDLEQRQAIGHELAKRGYAVSIFPDHLRMMPYHADLTELVDRDIQQILLREAVHRGKPSRYLVLRAIALFREADAITEEAQALFTPFEESPHDISLASTSSLHRAALKFQAARRLLQEGNEILEEVAHSNSV
jgi:hypothetical protein